MRRTALALTLSALALPASAHVRVQNQAKTEKVHKVEKIADNAYVIYGQGGNIGLFVTSRHAVLVDDQFAKLAPDLMKAIRSVTDKPVKYLINTHHHGDHTGGNAVLADQVTAIIAHTNVRKRMIVEQQALKPEERGGLPELALGEADPNVRALLAIHLDGLEVHLLHPGGPGHTDGDLAVGVPSTRVLHLGDLFFNGLTPFVDLSAGGSLKAMRQRADEFLAWIPEDTVIIPGHGPVARKKDLARFRDFLKAVEAHVAAHPGKTGAELDASFDHKAWEDFHDLKPFLSWDKFFDIAAGRMPKE